MKPGNAFHAYPTQQQKIVPYDRGTPLACDAVEFDETGCFDIAQYGFVAPGPCTVAFYGEILWQAPPDSGFSCAVIAKNPQAGLPPGTPTGEMAGGLDTVFYSPADTGHPNQGTQVRRILQLQAGDVVKLMPMLNCGGTLASATGGANGASDCNFFEGIVLSVGD